MTVLQSEPCGSTCQALAMDAEPQYALAVARICFRGSAHLPLSIVHQQRIGVGGDHIDIGLESPTGQIDGVEMKRNAAVDLDQLRRYAKSVRRLALIAPEAALPHVRFVLAAEELPTVDVAPWESVVALMGTFRTLVAHQRQLTDFLIAADPAKHIALADLCRARISLESAATESGFELGLGPSDRNLPALNLGGDHVFAQVQKTSSGWQSKIGFRVAVGRERVTHLLRRAHETGLADAALATTRVGRSVGRGRQPFAVSGCHRYGYADDYVGVQTTPVGNATAAARAMLAVARAFESSAAKVAAV